MVVPGLTMEYLGELKAQSKHTGVTWLIVGAVEAVEWRRIVVPTLYANCDALNPMHVDATQQFAWLVAQGYHCNNYHLVWSPRGY